MITKIGTVLIKEAGPFNTFMQGANLFRKNIGPAFKTLGTGIPRMGKQMFSNISPAWQAMKNTYDAHAPVAGILKNTLGAGWSRLRDNASTGLTPDMKKALAMGATGLTTAGMMAYGAHKGNKEYKTTLQDLNRMKQYQITNPSKQFDTNQPQPDITGND